MREIDTLRRLEGGDAPEQLARWHLRRGELAQAVEVLLDQPWDLTLREGELPIRGGLESIVVCGGANHEKPPLALRSALVPAIGVTFEGAAHARFRRSCVAELPEWGGHLYNKDMTRRVEVVLAGDPEREKTRSLIADVVWIEVRVVAPQGLKWDGYVNAKVCAAYCHGWCALSNWRDAALERFRFNGKSKWRKAVVRHQAEMLRQYIRDNAWRGL